MKRFRDSFRARRSGFTLVEILVAVAILSIVAVGLLQILGLSMQTWQQGLAQTNCYTKARVVLDSATADIQRGVFRSDVNNFPVAVTTSTPPMPIFTFYTRAAGASTGTVTPRPISLVSYQLSSSPGLQGYLLRSENTISWSGSGSNLNFLQPLTPVSPATVPATGPPNDLLSTGIVDFEMIFFLSDGTTVLAKNFQAPSAASVVMIGLAVAVIDDQAMTQLHPTTSSDFTNIQTALENALTSNFSSMTASSGTYTSANYGRSIKELWDPAMAPFYQSAGYPRALATGFQTFERFVPCTPFN
jgi:prepilin-type N-terminal cleavage/methylation domain-containing protein